MPCIQVANRPKRVEKAWWVNGTSTTKVFWTREEGGQSTARISSCASHGRLIWPPLAGAWQCVYHDRTPGRLVSVLSCPLTVTMSLFTQLIDHLPDELQDKARTIAHSIDRVPEGIKRTEDTIDGSCFDFVHLLPSI